MDHISSKENKKIKKIRLLLEKRSERKKTESFIVEGLKMVNEAITLERVTELFISDFLFQEIQNMKKEELSEEKRKLQPFLFEKNVSVVTDGIFRSISETVSPQGVLAIARQPKYEKEAVFNQKKLRLIILEDLQDPGNLGTIMRTAEAAGMSAVILTEGCVDLFNPKVVRSTMGSIFRLPFFYVADLKEEILHLQASDVVFYATHLKAVKNYRMISYAEKSAILIGNESNGLKEETSDLSDVLVKIPMKGKVESLNAAVAASLMMYETLS